LPSSVDLMQLEQIGDLQQRLSRIVIAVRRALLALKDLASWAVRLEAISVLCGP